MSNDEYRMPEVRLNAEREMPNESNVRMKARSNEATLDVKESGVGYGIKS